MVSSSITLAELFSPSQRLAMLSNLSTAYNVANIGLVLSILTKLYPDEHSDTSDSLSASSLIAGMIFGQVLGGALGDLIGRANAMYCVMGLQVLGSLGSATIISAKISTIDLDIFEKLAIWRFVLGLGAGGVYPLAAVLSAEQKDERGNNNGNGNGSSSGLTNFSETKRWQLISLTFSTQGIGFLLVPIVTLIVVSILGEESYMSWRIILGFGCVPGVMILLSIASTKCTRKNTSDTDHRQHQLQCENDNDDTPVSSRDHNSITPTSIPIMKTEKSTILSSILTESHLMQKLLGTAATWLLFDVLFYGNTLFQPIVINATFGSQSSTDGEMKSISQTTLDALFIWLIALPGYFVAVYKLGSQSPRYIQSQGFCAMAILYACIGFLWDELVNTTKLQFILFLLYALTFFFSNYGPNTTTFMLPSITFLEPNSRSTLNGISAAAGKTGALLGATFFKPMVDDWGEKVVFFVCSCLSILAFCLTRTFLEDTKHVNDTKVTEETNLLVTHVVTN